MNLKEKLQEHNRNVNQPMDYCMTKRYLYKWIEHNPMSTHTRMVLTKEVRHRLMQEGLDIIKCGDPLLPKDTYQISWR